MDRFNLSVEELEERIAPANAPGLGPDGPGADAPPGESANALANSDGVVVGNWFGQASEQF
jgi:hypothetical protein